jgi:hypothetical protein
MTSVILRENRAYADQTCPALEAGAGAGGSGAPASYRAGLASGHRFVVYERAEAIEQPCNLNRRPAAAPCRRYAGSSSAAAMARL